MSATKAMRWTLPLRPARLWVSHLLPSYPCTHKHSPTPTDTGQDSHCHRWMLSLKYSYGHKHTHTHTQKESQKETNLHIHTNYLPIPAPVATEFSHCEMEGLLYMQAVHTNLCKDKYLPHFSAVLTNEKFAGSFLWCAWSVKGRDGVQGGGSPTPYSK